MVEHTPGPWRVVPMGETDDDAVAARYAYVEGPNDDDPFVPPAEWRFQLADARLIASAPNLLEALRAIRDEMMRQEYVDPTGAPRPSEAETWGNIERILQDALPEQVAAAPDRDRRQD